MGFIWMVLAAVTVIVELRYQGRIGDCGCPCRFRVYAALRSPYACLKVNSLVLFELSLGASDNGVLLSLKSDFVRSAGYISGGTVWQALWC